MHLRCPPFLLALAPMAPIRFHPLSRDPFTDIGRTIPEFRSVGSVRVRSFTASLSTRTTFLRSMAKLPDSCSSTPRSMSTCSPLSSWSDSWTSVPAAGLLEFLKCARESVRRVPHRSGFKLLVLRSEIEFVDPTCQVLRDLQVPFNEPPVNRQLCRRWRQLLYSPDFNLPPHRLKVTLHPINANR